MDATSATLVFPTLCLACAVASVLASPFVRRSSWGADYYEIDAEKGENKRSGRPDTWPTALGYGPWVEEVWVKFISDAIAHGAKPPQIELGATAGEEGSVRFWVRDNGPSMTIERQDGVGMVVVRRIMEKLGREVSLESAGDEGNILSFTLRAA